MEADSMDDLSDGVSKLQEFSAVLSSVTRGLDKNVRRLEDQFNKANGALKDMKDQVIETQATTSKLRQESDAQLKSLKDAVSIAANFEAPVQRASEYLLDPQLVMDTRSVSVMNMQAAERAKEDDAHHVAKAAHDHKSWLRIVDDSSSLLNRQLGLEINEALHSMNRTLIKPKAVSKEEEREEKKMTDAERATAAAKDFKRAIYPFPEIDANSSVGHAMSAIIQRMYRLEAAVTIQTGVNEALVKIVRDDTQVQAVYDAVIENIVEVENVQRELATDTAKLRSALGKLGDHVEAYEKSMSELARGGKLRVEKRDKRTERNIDDDEVENIEWGLDAYTVEESDYLSKRIAVVEAQLSSSGAVGVALRRINNDIEDLQSSMVERQEAEKNLKRAMEESASSTGILKKKIVFAKEKWQQVVEDLKFGIANYHAKAEARKSSEDENEHEDGDDEADEEEDGEDGEEETEKVDITPKKLPAMLVLLSKLHDDVEAALVNSFYIHDNLDDTLDVVCPRLDELTLQLEDVFALDTEIRFGVDPSDRAKNQKDKKDKTTIDDEEEEDEEELPVVTLSDVMTSNRDYMLKSSLQNAMVASLPVIDEKVDKIGMRRRIEKIEKASVSQDVLEAIERSSKDMHKQLKSKANKEDVALALSKRVLKSDILRLKELVMNHLDLSAEEHDVISQIADEAIEMTDSSSIASSSIVRSPTKSSYGGGNQTPQSGPSNGGGGSAMPSFGGAGASSKEVQEVSGRIELLLKHMQELQTNCQTFIPREEVQEAMKAVLYEIKVIKMNTVNVNKFKEVTDLKADKDEMHSLMQVLTEALGDMMGLNVSSAAKQRCLLCDKPTSSVSHHGEVDRSPSPPRTRGGPSSNQQSSLIDSIDESSVSATRPSTSQPRLASSSSTSRLPNPRGDRSVLLAEKASIAKAQITTEITVLKNSVDLPSIDQPNARNHATEKKGLDMYKSRVRSSGGGGNIVQ